MITDVEPVQPTVTTEPAAPAQSAAPAATVVDPGKSGPAKPWMAQLKKDLQTNAVLSQFDDFSSVAEKWLEIDGKKDRLIEIPGTDAPEEKRAEFRAKLGVPDKPEEYKFTVPELPKDLNLKWNPEAEAQFRKLAHQAGLNNDQAKFLLEFDTQMKVAAAQAHKAAQVKAAEAQAQQDKAILSELQSSWGQKFEENKAKAGEAMKKTTSEDFRKLLADKGVLDHPLTAKHFFDLANNIGESQFIIGGTAPVPQTPQGPLKFSPEVLASLPKGSGK